MDSSRFISRVLGLYLVILNTVLFFHQQEYLTVLQSLSYDPALIFVLSMWLIGLGLVMIICHNIWRWNWRLLVTLLCWLTFIKGLGLLIYPNFILRTVQSMAIHPHQLMISLIIDFILGLVLCYFAFNKS